jgi:hypothetical protein
MWTLQGQDKSRIAAAEMKFLKKTTKYTLFDHKRNQYVIKKLRTQFWKKSTLTNTNGYNTFAEWTYLDSHTLLQNANHSERQTLVAH